MLVFIHCADNGFLKTFFEKTKSMNPGERADYLEKDDVSIISNKYPWTTVVNTVEIIKSLVRICFPYRVSLKHMKQVLKREIQL